LGDAAIKNILPNINAGGVKKIYQQFIDSKLFAEVSDETTPIQRRKEILNDLWKNLSDKIPSTYTKPHIKYSQIQKFMQTEQKLLPEQKSAPVQTEPIPQSASSEPPPELQEEPKIPTKSKYKVLSMTEKPPRPKNYKVLSMTEKPPRPKPREIDEADYSNDLKEIKERSRPKVPEIAITPDAKTIPAEAGAENLMQDFGASLSRAGVDALTNAGTRVGANVLMGAANLRDPRNRLMDGRRTRTNIDPALGISVAQAIGGGLLSVAGGIARDAYNTIYPPPLQAGQAQNAQNSDGRTNAPNQPPQRPPSGPPSGPPTTTPTGPKQPEPDIRTKLENRIKEFKIETPMTEKLISTKQTTGDILTTQEQPESRGFLKPKFIIPSSDIFNKSIQEEYIDDLEFSMFDFVKDDSGGLDPNNDNYLIRDQRLTEALRYQNAGVNIPSLYGQKPKYTENLFIPKDDTKIKIPEISFLYGDAINEFNLSEFETKIYDPNNDRTAIDVASPYYYMTDNQLLDQYIDTSILYGVVP